MGEPTRSATFPQEAYPSRSEFISMRRNPDCCAFPPPGAQAQNAPLIRPEELPGWVIEEDTDFLAFNKPGWVVCHPSKNGPWSSLVGAVREWRGGMTMHLVSRLDRETSGIILIALNREAASKSQKAVERRWVSKTYLAILEGEMREPQLVDAPLRPDTASPVLVKQCVGDGPDAQTAVTFFEPLFHGNGYTLTRVELHTGRKHQIRAHAQYIGHCVVGDKLYGHNEKLYLDFCENGWTERHDKELELPRQALHAARLVFKSPEFQRTFSAPLPQDMRDFCLQNLGMNPADLEKAMTLD